jgi:3-oxoacyl-[acyl-carrier protein] reductase
VDPRQPSATLSARRLGGQAAVVTGASRGIGRAIALTLAREGARVVVNHARSPELADTLVAEIRAAGGEALAARADVSRLEEVDGLLGAALEAFGRVDAWVNNAGADILTGEARAWPAERQWDEVMAVDLKGTWLCSRAAAEAMRRGGGGVIVNFSWDHVAHGMGNPTAAIYAAAKGGVAAMSRSLAREFAPEVRVNVVAPGWIRTEWLDGAGAEVQHRVAEATPLGRPGTPDDVAGAVAFLASAEAKFITGQTLAVNGGVVMA